MYMSHVVDPKNYLLANLKLCNLTFMPGVWLLGCGIHGGKSGLKSHSAFESGFFRALSVFVPSPSYTMHTN